MSQDENGSWQDRSRRTARVVLLLANSFAAAAAVVFALVGAWRPGYVFPGMEVGSLAQFWSQASAARTLPLAGLLLVLLARPGSRALPAVLVAAGLVQAGDAALGLFHHNIGMTIGSAVPAALHLFTARRLTAVRTPGDPPS